MNFIFIDETGEAGNAPGSSPYFGIAMLQVQRQNYRGIVQLLSQVRWLNNVFGEIKKLKDNDAKIVMIIRGLATLAEDGKIAASGIYIDKQTYGGRYLTWVEREYPQTEWPYHLRIYLLRHLLELHFSNNRAGWDEIDLILDRMNPSAEQRQNIQDYLNSKTPIALREPFKIPPVAHVTIADSEYVCGLELVHILTKIMNKQVSKFTGQFFEMTNFMKVIGFVGHRTENKNELG